MIDFQRLNYEPGKEDLPFEEKVVEVRYDPCRWAQLSNTLKNLFGRAGGPPPAPVVLSTRSGPRGCARRSADIALVAGGNRKRWIIASENMQEGDVIKTSAVIGRMAGKDLQQRRRGGVGLNEVLFLTRNHPCVYSAVSANEGDAYPLGALPVGTLVNNLELQPGKGSEYIRAAGTLVTGTSQVLLLLWLHLFSAWRDERRFAAQSQRNCHRPAPVEAAGAGEAFCTRAL